MIAIALVLSLNAQPVQPAFTPWRAWDSLFRSDQEGTNFAAHVGWSFAVPLAGHAIAGKKGAYIAGGAWVAYALIDEATHIGQNGYDARERNLDLISKILPCAAVMLWEALR